MSEILQKHDDDARPWGPVVADLKEALSARLQVGTWFASWNTIRAHSPEYWRLYTVQNVIRICIEVPVLGRLAWSWDVRDDLENTYWRLALDDCASLYDGQHFNLPGASGPDRFYQIAERCNIALEPRVTRTNGNILYICQVAGDTGMKGTNPFEAAIYDLYRIRRFSRHRPIIVSVHPDCYTWASDNLQGQSFELLRKFCQVAGHHLTTQHERTQEFFPETYCAVMHSSGTSTETIAAGIRTITLHPGNFCYPVTPSDIAEIESFSPMLDEDRLRWFSRIAYCQWTRQEILDGTALNHLIPGFH